MDHLAYLFERYRSHGDLAALGVVFDQSAPRLLALAMHLCGNPADAEDALQQTFILAMRRAHAFDRTRQLEPWLAGLLTNAVRASRRGAGRRRAEPLPPLASEDEGPVAAAERAELVAALRTHIDLLPSNQRQVLLLQLQYGLAPAAIAEVLEQAPGTVRMRLLRGLQSLRRLLPAALAGWLMTMLPARGLAAVRQAVMREARRAAAGGVAAGSMVTCAGGVLAMKKVFAVLIVGLVAVAVWWGSGSPAAEFAPAAADGPAPAAIVIAADTTTVGRAAAAVAPPPRASVGIGPGSLRVRARMVVPGSGSAQPDRVLPIAGAVLEVWSGESALAPFDPQPLVIRTDAAGDAVLASLTPGRWWVLDAAESAARDSAVEAQSAMVEPGVEACLDVTRHGARIVRGRVVDAADQPVAEAEVWALRHGGRGVLGRHGLPEPCYLRERRVGMSDASGRFEIALADREDTFGARKVGHAPSRGRYPSDAGESEFTLRLGRAHGAVAGFVRDPAGKPVRDALVSATPIDADERRDADGTLWSGHLAQLARSDAAGCVEFAALAPGRYQLGVLEPLHPAACEVEVKAFTRAEVELRSSPGVMVVGTVRHADGSPAAVGVAARPSADLNGHYIECGSRSDGTYVLPWVPARTFFVTVQAGRGPAIAVREFKKPAPGLIRCDFVLPDVPPLRGRVVDEHGAALVGWCVHAADPAHAQSGRSAVTDGEGRFELRYLQGESFQVKACAPDGDLRQPACERAGVSLGSGPLELRVAATAMPCGTLTGRLVGSDGRAMADTGLVLHKSDGSYPMGVPTQTSADGTFHLAAIVAGAFALTHGGGTTPRRTLAQFELAHAQHLDLGDLVVAPLATLRIELARADGSPWRGSPPYFTAYDAAGKAADAAWQRVPDGLEASLVAGHYRVALRGTDLTAAEQEVDLRPGERGTLRVVVATGRTRRLVFNGDGKHRVAPGTVLHLEVRREDGEVVLQRDTSEAIPNLRGSCYWSLAHAFAPGRYEVTAHTDTGQRYQAAFTVRDDLDDPSRVDVASVRQ